MMQEEIHPCFTKCCSDYARVHLPIAPKCNIQCNYCLRKFDCVNESRPGVTSKVMLPQDAVDYYKKISRQVPLLTTLGIAGPGDALANFTELEETLRLIRAYDEKVIFCLSTNGLMLPKYASKLKELGVKYLTITINAINPNVANKIYSMVEFENKVFEGSSAAQILLEQQKNGLAIAKDLGFKIKINTVAIPGINIEEIPLIAAMGRKYGCELMNIIPLISIPETPFSDVPLLDKEKLDELRNVCGTNIRQMLHCKHCRADAVGNLR